MTVYAALYLLVSLAAGAWALDILRGAREDLINDQVAYGLTGAVAAAMLLFGSLFGFFSSIDLLAAAVRS